MTLDQAIALTVDWYKNFKEKDVYTLCAGQIEAYSQLWGNDHQDIRNHHHNTERPPNAEEPSP